MDWMKNQCFFWKEASHKATDYKKVANISKRKQRIASKKLCLKCLCECPQAIECKKKVICCNCYIKHYTSMLPVSRKPPNATSDDNN